MIVGDWHKNQPNANETWRILGRQSASSNRGRKIRKAEISRYQRKSVAGTHPTHRRRFQRILTQPIARPTRHTISTPFSIVSPRLALARGKWETAGHVQYDLERSDAAVIKPKRSNPRPIAQGLLISQTPDNRNAESCESYPYEKRFGFTAEGEPIYDDEMFTPDGTMTDTYISALWEITK